jgi:hypothetical protein
MPSRHSDKWDQLYFLKYNGDKIIDESAELYTKFFSQVPPDHKLTTGDSGGGWTSVGDLIFPLRKVKISDKLFIVAHGEANGEVGERAAGTLAHDLKQWGLKSVGLITFKCCNLARGGFLQLFVSECSLRGITVGWVKGYTGIAITYVSVGGPSEFIKGDHGIPKLGDARLKIVQGNHPTPLQKFERYSYEEEVKPAEPEKKSPPIVRGIAVTKGTHVGKSIWDSRHDAKS